MIKHQASKFENVSKEDISFVNMITSTPYNKYNKNYHTNGLNFQHNSKITALGRHLKSIGMVSAGNKVASFDLLSGITCPYANDCHTWVKVTRQGKRIQYKGKCNKFQCYASKAEGQYPTVYTARYRNTILVQEYLAKGTLVNELVDAIKSLGLKVIRIHSAGGMFSVEYAKAWAEVAKQLPDVIFFGYTKGQVLMDILNEPDNMHFVFSIGSKQDELITDEPTATVVLPGDNFKNDIVCTDKTDAQQSADFFQIVNGQSFGLALH